MRRVHRNVFFGIMAVGGLTLCSVLCGLDYEVQVLPPIPGGKGPDPERHQQAVVLVATCEEDKELWEGRDDYVDADGFPCEWPDLPYWLSEGFIALDGYDPTANPYEWSISNYLYHESMGKHLLYGEVNGSTGEFLCWDETIEYQTCGDFETEMRREAAAAGVIMPGDAYYIYVFPRTPLDWPEKSMSGSTTYGGMTSYNGSSGYYVSEDNRFDLNKLVALVAHEYGHCLGNVGLPDKYQTPLPRPDVATRTRIGHFRNDGTQWVPSWTHVTNKYNSIEEKQGQVRPVFVDIDDDNDLDMFLGVAVKVGTDLKGRVLFYEWDEVNSRWKTSVWLRDHSSDIIESHGAPASPEFVDIDGNGYYDLFLAGNGYDVYFYRNDINGFCKEGSAVESFGGYSKTVRVGDIDNDGVKDVYVAHKDYNNPNVGRIHHYEITDVSTQPPTLAPRGMVKGGFFGDELCVLGGHVGLDLVDIDNDGDIEMFIGHKDGHISYWESDGGTPPHWSLIEADYQKIDLGYDLGYFPAPFFADIDGNSTYDLFIGYLDPFHGADNPYVLSGIVGMYSPMRITADPRITHVVPFSPLDKMKMEARDGNWNEIGWLTPTEITESGSNVLLKDFYSSGGKCYKIPFSNPTDRAAGAPYFRNPYFLIFNHQKVNRWEDEYGGTGVLIWHISENDPPMRYEEPRSGRRRVEDVECAIGLFDTSGAKPGDATPCPEFGWDNIDHWTTPGNEPIWMDFNESHNASTGAATDFFGHEDRTEFSHVSNPSTNAYNFNQIADITYQSGEWHTGGLNGHRFWEEFNDEGPVENIATHIAIKNISIDGNGVAHMDILTNYVQSDVASATAGNNGRHIAWDGTKPHMVYTSNGHVYYTYYEEQFGTMRWMSAIPLDQRDYSHSIPYPRPPEFENKYPTLALDSNGKPCVCWVYEEDGLSSLYYYHPDLPSPYELYASLPTGLCDFSGPSIAVDDQDLVHVVFTGREGISPWECLVKYGTFSATSPSPPSWYEIDCYIQIVGEERGTASVDAASGLFSGLLYVTWEREGNIYYKYSTGTGWSGEIQITSSGSAGNPSIDVWTAWEDTDVFIQSIDIVWNEDSKIRHYRKWIKWKSIGDDIFEEAEWEEAIAVVSDAASEPASSPQIAGGSHVLFIGSPDSKAYRAKYKDGRWRAPTTWGGAGNDHFPQLAVQPWNSSTGILHCVYTELEPDGDGYRLRHKAPWEVLALLMPPMLVYPMGGDTATSLDMTLQWQDVEADSYAVRYSTDSLFSTYQETTGIELPQHTIEGNAFENDTILYWQVHAFNDTIERITQTYSFFWDLPTTYWVDDANGNDENVGSKSESWATIQKAASELQSYERVFVRAGNYHEQVVPANSGELDDRIYYVAYPGETVVLDGDGQLYGFNIHGKSYLTFDGFNLTDYTTASVKISQAGTPASHNVIANCNISSSINSLQGIHIWGSSEALCKGNLIENTSVILNNEAFYNVKLEYAPNTQLLNDSLRYATYGVRIAESDSVSIVNSVISDMESYGIYGNSNVLSPQILNNTLHKTGAYAGAFFQESRNAEIIGNSVDSSGTGSTGAAIWCDTRCDHAVIQGNNITLGEGQATIGIKTRTDCDSTTISGNTFSRSGDWSSEAAIYLGQSCNHVDIYENIVQDASFSGIVVGGVSGGCSGVRLWNNNVASKNIGISIPKKTQSNIRMWNNVIRAACGIRNFGAEESWFGFNTVWADTGIYLNDLTGTADEDTLLNNILSCEDYCIFMKILFSAPSGYRSDFNDLHNRSGHVGFWRGDRSTLSAWQSASSGDAQSLSADPLFVSEADLHITESSSCVDAGTAIPWITIDYEGQLRSDPPPDIGCDEYYAETGGGCMGGADNSPFIFKLAQNYPNPFRQGTTIRYSIPKMGKVTLRIYDVTGRMVKQLVNKEQRAGVYTANWEGNTPNNRKLATGVYFVRLTANEKTATRKLVMVR